jgi:hypothetical protein
VIRAIFRAIYDRSMARVRVRTPAGEEVLSEKFSVNRGVIQGDVFSPLCFIVALESIMRSHGGTGSVSVRGVPIDRLEYADDAALVDRDSATASERVSRLCIGASHDADMDISAPKSEAMFCRPRIDTGAITQGDYEQLELPFKCGFCERGFDSRHGCNVHAGRWCDAARVEMYEEEYEIEEVLDARGAPEQRFYYVKWLGWGAEHGSWKHWRELDKAQEVVDRFWDTGPLPAALRACTIVVAGENRCPLCNQQHKREQDLKAHHTRGCPRKEASRVGTRAETAVRKQKQVEAQEAAGTVMMGAARLKNVFNFKYLGFNFQADGDRLPALIQRMAIARTRFGQLHEVWRSKKLHTEAKIRIYACAVVSILSYGNEIWLFTDRVKSKLKGWNAKCLSTITGREIAEECRTPTFDLVSRLRSRRLRWAGHILRMEESSLLRRVFLAQAAWDLEHDTHKNGGLLTDAPAWSSIDHLQQLAASRDAWRDAVHALLPETDPGKRKSRNKKKKESQNRGWYGPGTGFKLNAQGVIVVDEWNPKQRPLY